MGRPVTCRICGKDMYYSEDIRHEPEWKVALYDHGDPAEETFYVHRRCWNKLFDKFNLFVSGVLK